MSRARFRNKELKNINKQELIKMIESKIYISELKEIATLYYVQEHSQIDISFELNKSERTIFSSIKEIEKILE